MISLRFKSPKFVFCNKFIKLKKITNNGFIPKDNNTFTLR